MNNKTEAAKELNTVTMIRTQEREVENQTRLIIVEWKRNEVNYCRMMIDSI